MRCLVMAAVACAALWPSPGAGDEAPAEAFAVAQAPGAAGNASAPRSGGAAELPARQSVWAPAVAPGVLPDTGVELFDGRLSSVVDAAPAAPAGEEEISVPAAGCSSWLLACALLVVAFGPFAAFQYKILPLWIGKHVSCVYFWPTLPLTLLRSWKDGRGLWCAVDDTVFLGVVPLSSLGHPAALHCLGVRGVVNMNAEWAGPEAAYARLQMRQLRLPTVDHQEPAVEDMIKAVQFIEEFKKRGQRVYVHCKAGHGRAAAVTLAWLAYSRGRSSDDQLREINAELLSKRRVRKTLHQQPHLRAFGCWVGEGGNRREPRGSFRANAEASGVEVEMAVRQRLITG